MKTSIRERIGIIPKMMDLLNEQVKQEQHASSSYLAMASWCEQNGFTKSAQLFYDQSIEEREHMMKIFSFVLDNGGAAFSPSIDEVNHSYSSLLDVFQSALALEITVTENIQKIMKAAKQSEDYNTEAFIQWFVSEQSEEEKFFRDIIQMIELMGDSPLQLIDDRIQKPQ